MRLRLERGWNDRPGAEKVTVCLFGHHYDDDGPVLGSLKYVNEQLGWNRQLELDCSANRNDWPTIAGRALVDWDDEWLSEKPLLCTLHEEDLGHDETKRSSIEFTNSIVLQHLARLQGVLSRGPIRESTPDSRALMHTMTRQLGGIIVRGNTERQQSLAELL
jgi:hypothetical protein